jgi:Na+/H+ antiporter NhaC
MFLICALICQFGGIIVAIDTHRVLLRRKATSSKKTYNLYKMLQNALLVDYALIYFLMTIPMTIVLICLICKVPYTGIMASIVVMSTSCHSFLGMISMCYFIKIFRVTLVDKSL